MQESLLPEAYPLDHNVQPQRNAQRWNFVRQVVGVLFLLAFFLFVVMSISSGLHGWSAYRNGTQLQELLLNNARETDLPQIRTLLTETGAALDGLDRDMWFWGPLLHRLDWFPEYGPTVAAVPELVSGGNQLLHVADDSLLVMEPLLDESQPLLDSLVNVSIPDATTLFVDNKTSLKHMAERAEVATQALTSLDPTILHPRLIDPLTIGQALLPIMAPALRSLPHLENLIGNEKPQTYLILVQNNDELRATGGFITAFGHLDLNKGKLETLKFADSYWVRREGVEYPGAPKPMQRYMGTRLMFFRDANWSPDLPTTAHTVKAIFRQDTDVDVQGVITVDMNALSLITNALAPLTLAGVDKPVDGKTIIGQIKQFWDKPANDDSLEFGEWWMQRKAFMPTLTDAVLTRVASGDVEYVDLVLAAVQALDERAIQLWIDQPNVAAELALLGWDGALHAPANADFIGLVDSNLGYNKVDSVIERSVNYYVDWFNNENEAERRATATLSVTYRHPVQIENHRCDITPRYGNSYDDMAARCYFDYVRLYVPVGSELIEIDGVLADSASSKRGEGGTQVFGGYFVLPPGEEQVITFTYHLPQWIQPPADGAGYPLVVQRQSGTRPLSLTLDIDGRQLSSIVRSGSEQLHVK